ncbi:MAG: ABC transporter ATP-binding protein [Pseudomonadota bacterium]
MLTIQQLSMHYEAEDGSALRILESLDLDVAAGESVAITGPSGCGKTTLLLLLAGLERPTSGAVALSGQELTHLDADALADLRRDKVGIIFQAFHLVPSISALENVALPLQIAGRPGSRETASNLLERVGLGSRKAHLPAKLSGGEKQRVAIARALAHQPALLLADEPTGNLDENTGAVVSDLLFDLHRESNSAMVVVTHDLGLAARCDRILQLHQGQLEQSEAGTSP